MAVLLSGCSQAPDTSKTATVTKPLLSEVDAEKVVADRFPVARYVVNDFIPKPGAPTPSPVAPPQTIRIGLYWVLNDEMTPWYVAQDKGFFSSLGLDIHFDEGGPGRDMLGSLIANREDMYVGPAENALFVINSRTGTDLKMICALMKDTPTGLIGLDTSVAHDQASTRHIGRDDLIGHRLAITPGRDYVVDVICSELNIAPSDLHITAAGATPDGLVSGAIDYYEGFVTNQPRILERNGYKNWTFFPFSDVGLKDYFDVSTVTADFYQHNGPALTNYVYALNEAIQYEIAHPDEAAEIAVRHSTEYPVTKEEALWRIKRDIPIYQGDGSEPLLAMKASVIQNQLAMLYRYRQIELPDAPAGK